MFSTHRAHQERCAESHAYTTRECRVFAAHRACIRDYEPRNYVLPADIRAYLRRVGLPDRGPASELVTQLREANIEATPWLSVYQTTSNRPLLKDMAKCLADAYAVRPLVVGPHGAGYMERTDFQVAHVEAKVR